MNKPRCSFIFFIACIAIPLFGMSKIKELFSKKAAAPQEREEESIPKETVIKQREDLNLQIPFLKDRIFALAFSHSGSFLAVATQEEEAIGSKGNEIPAVSTEINYIIRILDMDKFKKGERGLGIQKAVLRRHTRPITALIFLENNTLISASGDKTIKIWDFQSMEKLKATIQIGRSPLTSLAGSPLSSEEIVVGSADKNVYIVNIQNKTIMKTLRGHRDQVKSVSVSWNGLIASGSYDRTVRIWDLQSGAFKRLLTDNCPIEAVLFDPRDNLKLLSAGWSKIIHEWNPSSGERQVLAQQTHRIFSLANSKNGEYIAVGSRFKTPDGSKEASSIEPPCVGIPGSLETPLHLLLTIGGRMFSVELPGHVSDVQALAFNPQTQELVSASIEGKIILWDVPAIVREVKQWFSIN